MKTVQVALVGCGKAKLGVAAPVRELYTGGLFRASLADAERMCGGHVFVASAAHGLLPLAEVVEPYDVTLRTFTRQQRQVWGAGVLAQLQRLYPAGAVRVLVYAGKVYAEPLRAALSAGWEMEEPLAGLSQGQRLAILKQRRLASAVLP